MAPKKKSLFGLIWRFFVSDNNSRFDKEKRKKWIFRRVKVKRVASLSAPSPPPREIEVAVEPSTCDLPVVGVSVDDSNVIGDQKKELQESCTSNIGSNDKSQVYCINAKEIEDLAAIKIQATFRGHLARKALRALRGVVKLQALIRGWAVRRQALNTLKCLQSIVSIQSEICSKRCTDDRSHFQDYYCARDFKEKDIKVDLNSQKRWDDSILTKEESKALFLSKREASVKRERIKEYYLHHRRSAETERDKAYGRRRYWLEQWVDAQLAKKDDMLTDPDKPFSRKKDEALDNSPARRTTMSNVHHRKQRSVGEESSLFPGSPGVVPTYMAATESARAKARSMSSPRLRPLNLDVCSEIASPYKHRMSPISSINSELTSSSWIGNAVGFPQRSPRLRGVSGPVKSTASVKEIRIQGIHQGAGQNGVGK